METLTAIATFTVVFGVVFFLFCAGLVFWYLFNQPKQVVSAAAPTASASDSSSMSSETPGVDG